MHDDAKVKAVRLPTNKPKMLLEAGTNHVAYVAPVAAVLSMFISRHYCPAHL